VCHFLNLPGELRNYIYSFIIYPHQERIAFASATDPKDLVSTLLRSPIYRTNRQIRAEALSYLCKSKTFTAINFRTAGILLEWTGPYGRAGLADMKLLLTYWDSSEDGIRESKQVVELLKDAKALRQLHLEFVPGFQLNMVTPAQWDVLGMMKHAISEEGVFVWGIWGTRRYEWATIPEQVQVVLGRENAVTM